MRLSLATTGSVKGSALLSRLLALFRAEIDPLLGFAFAFQRADLDDPAGADCDRGGRLDRAVLLHGLLLRNRLRLGVRRRVGIGQRLRRACLRGGLRQARGGQHAEDALSGAVIGRLRRHRELGDFGPVGLRGLRHHGAGRLGDFRTRRDGMGDRGRRLRGTGRRQFHRPGLDLDRLDLDRLHRLGRARDRSNRWVWMTPLVNGAGSGLACGSNLLGSGLAGGEGRAAAAAAISDGLAGAIERVVGSGQRRFGDRGGTVDLSGLGFGHFNSAVARVAFGDRGDGALGRALVEVLGEQVAHDGSRANRRCGRPAPRRRGGGCRGASR